MMKTKKFLSQFHYFKKIHDGNFESGAVLGAKFWGGLIVQFRKRCNWMGSMGGGTPKSPQWEGFELLLFKTQKVSSYTFGAVCDLSFWLPSANKSNLHLSSRLWHFLVLTWQCQTLSFNHISCGHWLRLPLFSSVPSDILFVRHTRTKPDESKATSPKHFTCEELENFEVGLIRVLGGLQPPQPPHRIAPALNKILRYYPVWVFSRVLIHRDYTDPLLLTS